MNPTITAVAGLEAGHYTDLVNATGCTVIICREGAVGGVDVRGGSPGTRETDLLRPMHRIDSVHGLVLSGGSAFGLDAASGVAGYLAEQGIGVKVGPTIIPIVSSAILFDLGLITSEVRPGLAEGRAACLAAGSGPMEEGSVGAGTGATVAKARGLADAVKSGIGSASLKLPGGAVAAAAEASRNAPRPVTPETIVSRWLVENANVYVNAGSSYGPGGEGHMRMNLGTSRQLIKLALDNIAAAVSDL